MLLLKFPICTYNQIFITITKNGFCVILKTSIFIVHLKLLETERVPAKIHEWSDSRKFLDAGVLKQ